MLVVVAIILSILAMFVANTIAKSKRQAGFAYGLALSWLDLIILRLLPARPALTAAEQLPDLERREGEWWLETDGSAAWLGGLTGAWTGGGEPTPSVPVAV